MDLNIATIVIQAVNFLIFAFIVSRFLYKPVMVVLNERRTQIERNMEEAEQAKTSAQNLRNEYEAKMSDARKEAQDVLKEAQASAEALKSEMLGDAKKEVQRVRDRADGEIRLEREKMEKELRAQVASLSISVAEKVLVETLDRDAQKKMVDEFIRKVGTEHGA